MRLMFDDSAVIGDIQEVNASFARGSLKVMYLGANQNKSYFDRAVVEAALPSLRNVPIVCHWDEDAEEIGGHDIEIASRSSGELYIKNLTEPCGVVPGDIAEFRFEVSSDENGNEHEYLVIDNILLWKRQDVYHHIVDELGGKVKHSMEISIDDGEMKDGVFVVKAFHFVALCLLERVDPCFQGSELELYSVDAFKAKMEEMLCELKETFSKANTPSTEIDNTHFSEEGGNCTMEEKLALLEKYSLSVDELDFALEDFSIEELEEKFQAMTADNGEATGAADAASEPAIDDAVQTEDFALNSNVREELRHAVGKVLYRDRWGDDVQRYWMADFDEEKKLVYCEDQLDWKLYGFTYSVDGDAVTVDFESGKRMKWDIVEYVGGEDDGLEGIMRDMMRRYSDRADEVEQNFAAASKQVEEMQPELEELRKFKAETDKALASAEKQAVLDKFSTLAGNEAYEALKEKIEEVSASDIEEKCFAILGRTMVGAKFSLNDPKPTRIPVDRADEADDEEKDPYGGIVKYYAGRK